MHELPRIAHVERFQVMFLSLSLSKHEHRLDAIEGSAGLIPIRSRHLFSHVTAITVDVAFLHPKFQCVGHTRPQCFVFVVELCHIPPVCAKRWLNFAGSVEQVVFEVVGGPVVVEGAVVGYPVDDHLHAVVVRSLHKIFEVGK